jgi:cation transport ATPase
MNAPHSGSANILTRTTLQIDGSPSAPSIANVVHALHRVQGVLFAEINAISARAVVAHDPAVSTASLLGAATGAGVRATIVADGLAPAVSGGASPSFARLSIRRLMPLIAALILLQALFVTVSPSLAKTHMLNPIVLGLVWAFLFFNISLKRRT